MKLNITTPEDHLGDFVGDLQQRRAMIHKTENRGKLVFIEAHAPLAELFGYSSAMRSLSQGRAGLLDAAPELRPCPARRQQGLPYVSLPNLGTFARCTRLPSQPLGRCNSQGDATRKICLRRIARRC